MSAARGMLAALSGFIVEPAERQPLEPADARPRDARMTVAVVGLSPRCGATTVARALGAELALRDESGAAIVTAATVSTGGVPLGTPAAARATRALSRMVAERMRPAGRLCLTTCGAGGEGALADAAREVAPLVVDVADPAQASVAASLADAVVLVAGAGTEPALAPVVAASLGRVGPEPLVVLNRDGGDADRWRERCAVALPDSRLGAQLALAGREPRADAGRALARLADLLAAER